MCICWILLYARIQFVSAGQKFKMIEFAIRLHARNYGRWRKCAHYDETSLDILSNWQSPNYLYQGAMGNYRVLSQRQHIRNP